MKNKLNIGDQVKIVMPGYAGDGEVATVTQIDLFTDTLYYTGIYHQSCPDGGEGYDNCIQFKEGQYETINSSKPVEEVISIQSKVRCKFMCHYKEVYNAGEENETALIKMSPVCAGSEENKEFFKYTPGGEINFYTVNKAASDQIEQGKEYYIDISLAE